MPRALLVLGVAALGLLALAPVASAGKYFDRFVAGGATSGSTAGLFNSPRGIAINDPNVADGATDPLGASTDGYVYVADDNNHRIHVFGPDDAFKFMFGRGVQSGGDGTQICDSSEVPCQAGTSDDEMGELDNPAGVAINQANGHVYVRDRDNRRVQEFTAAGQFVRAWGWDVVASGPGNDVVAPNNEFEVCVAANGDVCKIGTSGANGGQIASSTTASTGIAVDPSAPHHVFIVDPNNRRVQEFEADGDFVRLWGWDVVNTGQPGDIDADSFEICASTATGVCKVGSLSGPEAALGRFSSNHPAHIAVDGTSGVVFASDNANFAAQEFKNRIQRFDSDESAPADLVDPGIPVASITGTEQSDTRALNVDPDTGNLLVARQFPIGVLEIGSAATPTPTHADTHYANSGFLPNGVALNSVSGDLYVTNNSGAAGHRLIAADDDGLPAATASTLPATGVTDSEATLNGEISTSDLFHTDYRLEYSSNGVDWLVGGSGQVPGPATDAPVSATVTDLLPNTIYRVRLVVSRAFGNPEFESPEVPFLTDPKAPSLTDARAVEVTATSAALQGRINPHGTATSYRFEYGVGNFANSVPVPDGAIGNGQSYVFVKQAISGLQAGAEYQARLVATSAAGSTLGPSFSFTASSAAPVPEGRAYELVSPADKVGGSGVGLWGGGIRAASAGSGTAATQGERFAVGSTLGAILLDSASGYATDWAFAERTPSGWRSHTPVTHPPTNQQYFRFLAMLGASQDLSTVLWGSNGGLLRPFPELAPWPSIGAGFVGDWSGRWEMLAPTDFDQLYEEMSSGFTRSEVSEDSATVLTTIVGANSSKRAAVGGMAGPGDPSHPKWPDLVVGGAVYLDDVSAGLSDEFVGNGVYSNVGICMDDTLIPEQNGSSKLEDQPCAAPQPGRDSTLISPRGAAAHVESVAGPNAVSADASRTFFLSPDPAGSGLPAAGCTGTGGATLCTPQLYVRQRNADGSIATRWISHAEPGLFGSQNASLTGTVRFAGASSDGDKVFFQTNSPLTADDPNGTGAPVPGGVTTGAPSNSSWDLYMYDLPDGPDSDPSTADADPSGGVLTRISAGPSGTADCNVVSDLRHGSLRLVASDGSRAYFTCGAPLAGAGGPPSNSITVPGGTATSTDATNFYAYDNAGAGSWSFLARLPKIGNPAAACATANIPRGPLLRDSSAFSSIAFSAGANCVRGTADGAFMTFWTTARLTADDPDSVSLDGYAYDTEREELTRLTAAQGGAGESYVCNPDASVSPPVPCHGDSGFQSAGPFTLDVVTEPNTPGDRIAYFQSRSQLVAGDTDNAYDVYEWRNGKLGLISTGKSVFGGNIGEMGGSFYKGNTADGRNVYFATSDRLTWQDNDGVLDIYTARAGGGIPEPVMPPTCAVLADVCQGGQSIAPPASGASSAAFVGAGNVVEKPKKRKCAKGKVRKGKKCVKKNKRKAKRAAHNDRRAGK